MSAAIYSRVSRLAINEDADESESIESQDDECLEACEDRGWPVFGKYEDPGISASEFSKAKERPGWDRLVADLKARRFNVVVLWESSRGDRKPIEWLQFLMLCRDHGTLIHIINHDVAELGITYDVRRPSDMDKLSREGLDNAKSSSDTSQRIKRLKRRRRAKGLPDGSIPYGYKRRYHPDTGKIVDQVPDPETVPIVKEIYKRIAANEAILTIADDLNARGVPTPGRSTQWGLNLVNAIAKRPAYIAVIAHEGEEFAANWDPIVDEATFRKVQAIYAERRTNHWRPSRIKYLLSGIALCGTCGSPLWGHSKSMGYRCLRGHVGISMSVLDLQVSAVIVKYWSNPKRLREIRKNNDAEAVAAQTEVTRIETDLADLYAQAEALVVTATMAGHMERGLLASLEKAEQRRDFAATPPALRDLLDGPVEEMAERWAALTLPAKRSVIRFTPMEIRVDSAGGRSRNEEQRKVTALERIRFIPKG